MPTFFVQCYESGEPDGQGQGEVEAATAQEAAKAACGEKLAEGTKLGTLRAKVTPLESRSERWRFGGLVHEAIDT